MQLCRDTYAHGSCCATAIIQTLSFGHYCKMQCNCCLQLFQDDSHHARAPRPYQTGLDGWMPFQTTTMHPSPMWTGNRRSAQIPGKCAVFLSMQIAQTASAAALTWPAASLVRWRLPGLHSQQRLDGCLHDVPGSLGLLGAHIDAVLLHQSEVRDAELAFVGNLFAQ